MDPLIMIGGWAAALLSIAALIRLAYNATVTGIRGIFREELARVWRDMDDIENRLSALELSVQFIRQQLEELRRMMESHVLKEQ
jgi:hypothetical protein